MKILIFMFAVCSLILPIDLYAGETNGDKGRVIGREFQVNTQSIDDQYPVSITMETDGSFEITWYDSNSFTRGLYKQNYSPNGNVVGEKTQVYTFPYKTTAFAPNGSYVNVWISQDYTTYPSLVTVNYEKFDALSGQVYSGKAIEGYNSGDNHYPVSPAVGISSSGSFVVTWMIPFSGIYALKFDTTGNPLGDAFLVNSSSDGYVADPSVAMAADESFVITWNKTVVAANSIYDVFARRFADNSKPIGGDFKVNSYILSYQYSPLIAMAPDGSFVITWASYQQDGDGFGVFAKGFTAVGGK